MIEALENIHVMDGDRVAAEHVRTALTAGGFVYGDGSTQVFEPSGATTYVSHGQPTHGEWYLGDDGSFCSFWPPSFRACYDLSWIVEGGRIAGVRFTQAGPGTSFDGRYR
jgi:hypothetical protein